MRITGKLIAVGLGCIFTAVGILLSITIIGAIIGIPLIILGVTMIIRGLF
ncbi:MAG: hypothetical protein GX053_12040 [Tissierella sp.]|nr:hypothetical protein [Tissierella sp.]